MSFRCFFMKSLSRLLPQYASRRLFSRKSDLSHVRSWLEGFPGGDVLLRPSTKPDIMCLTLSHGKQKNALTGHMMVKLESLVGELEQYPPKGLILSGEGGSFCSGGSLKFVSQILTSTDGKNMGMFMQDVTSRIRNLPCVSVCLSEGSVIGGGVELSMSCDYRLATPTSIFSLRQAVLGVSCGWGGGVALVRRIGAHNVLRLILNAEDLNSTDALNIGLVDHIVGANDHNNAMEECVAWLHKLVQPYPKELVHVLKKMVLNGVEDGKLSKELKLFAEVWGSSSHVESVQKIVNSLQKKK